MVRIEVYNGWVIRTIPNNFVLGKSNGTTINQETGKETELYKDETFHSSFEGALTALCRKEIHACKATTIKGLQKEYQKLQNMVAELKDQLGEVVIEDGDE